MCECKCGCECERECVREYSRLQVMMMFVGLFLENDSEFLSRHGAHVTSTDAKQPTERTSLVY